MTESQTIKIAFVGCGGIAQAHWRGIQTHAPQLKVTATIDVDPTRAVEMAEQTGGQPFTSLETALEQGDFEAVDIMLPHHIHEEVAVRAFAAGKHVVLEKPMATTLDACDRILSAAKEAGTVFMIAEQSQYWPGVVKVQQLIREGAIGKVITAEAFFGGKVGSSWGSNAWRYNKAITGGGICIDGGSHWMRPLRMWLGEIDEVVAILDYPLKEMEGESLSHAIFRFKSGKYAAYKALRADSVMAPSEDFRVTGTKGILVIEKGHEGRVLLYDKDHREGREVLSAEEKNASAFGLELADFSRAVLEGTPLTAGPEESLGELRTALAMYRSAESHQWEKVWE
jgi:UDP-N-acetyl-2-amino-2-deoxyglucuronate dehydrogenase